MEAESQGSVGDRQVFIEEDTNTNSESGNNDENSSSNEDLPGNDESKSSKSESRSPRRNYKCANPKHAEWGKDGDQCVLNSQLSADAIKVFRLMLNKMKGRRFCQACITKAEVMTIRDIRVLKKELAEHSSQYASRRALQETSATRSCANLIHDIWGSDSSRFIDLTSVPVTSLHVFKELKADFQKRFFCEACVYKATNLTASERRSLTEKYGERVKAAKVERYMKEKLKMSANSMSAGDHDECSNDSDETYQNKQLRMLTFVNPGKFMEDFDPETSAREMRKMNRRIHSQNIKKNQMYDDNGRLLEDSRDLCDCLEVKCPGCHFPCPKCGSEKCGTECRNCRRWTYDYVEVEGTKLVLKWPDKMD